MRNVDEAVFSKVLGECVSDLRHSGWRLDEPGFGSGPCIWGTCAVNRDRKMGIESQNLSLSLSLSVSFFLCLNLKKKMNDFTDHATNLHLFPSKTSQRYFLNISRGNEYGEYNTITFNQMCL